MIHIYKACIRSIIEYGSIFMTQLNYKDSLMLDRIQWACIRVCLGSTKTTHTGSLDVLAGLCPLSIRRDSSALRFVNRRACLNTWHQQFVNPNLETRSFTTGLQRALHHVNDFFPLQNTLEQLPCFLYKPNVRKTVLSIDLSVMDLRSQEASTAALIDTLLEEKYSESSIIATDGSKDLLGTGYAVVNNFGAPTCSIKLPSTMSVYTAELLAIRKAVSIISDLPAGKYVIITDSMSCLSSLQNNKMSPSNPVAWYDIKKMTTMAQQQGSEIHFLWVPSHRGIQMNEWADQEAKLACRHGLPDDYTFTVHDVSFPTVQHARQRWQSAWNAGVKGRFCHSILTNVTSHPWFHQLQLDRREIVILSKLISNHSRLPAHLFRNRIIPSDVCNCGAINADPDHFLFACSNFSAKRNALWRILVNKGVVPDTQILLKKRDIEIYKTVAKFFVECKIDL
ncbi:uncharacterized protein LOC129738687 isoform X2 [Uranotaenia lowii]|nr:uncharacterized protein LOC129738687 isoform X2 [Uranotaenia lowii]